MYTAKIFGAGSIGNHLAHAARSHGWSVILSDVDPAALERTRESIYPGRYGAWDSEIVLKDSRDAMADPADCVFIGTPPDSHIKIALEAIEAAPPRALVIEKPLAGPDLAGCQELLQTVDKAGIFAAVGYNHTLARSTVAAEEILRSGTLGPVQTLSARTREHWGGIFKAHPWLSGPQDTYLGYYRRGGGACGEHSHAINIWQHFAHVVGAGRVAEVSATLDIVRDGDAEYDRLCLLNLRTEEGLVGDVIQDVVTAPTEKSARLQARDGFVEWHVNRTPEADAVIHGKTGESPSESLLPKTRPDDFNVEIAHLAQILGGELQDSPISLRRGLDTMMVIAAAFKAHADGRRVAIDWGAGYVPAAIS